LKREQEEGIKESRGGNQVDEKKGETYTRKVKHGRERRRESLRTLVPT
jgi:hypothetical protein